MNNSGVEQQPNRAEDAKADSEVRFKLTLGMRRNEIDQAGGSDELAKTQIDRFYKFALSEQAKKGFVGSFQSIQEYLSSLPRGERTSSMARNLEQVALLHLLLADLTRREIPDDQHRDLMVAVLRQAYNEVKG